MTNAKADAKKGMVKTGWVATKGWKRLNKDIAVKMEFHPWRPKGQIHVNLTDKAMAALKRVHATGFYGRTLDDTAERLLCETLGMRTP